MLQRLPHSPSPLAGEGGVRGNYRSTLQAIGIIQPGRTFGSYRPLEFPSEASSYEV